LEHHGLLIGTLRHKLACDFVALGYRHGRQQFEFHSVFVTISGDVNCDHKVDVYDLWEIGKAYASDETKPEWNPNADINNGRIVNNVAIAIVNRSLGQKW